MTSWEYDNYGRNQAPKVENALSMNSSLRSSLNNAVPSTSNTLAALALASFAARRRFQANKLRRMEEKKRIDIARRIVEDMGK